MNKINFQNGTLISKAKVTIDGTIYEVEPAEYEGSTPLSAEILNQMQNNIENEIEGRMLKEEILYESETGSTTSVTLSDSAENYNYLEIFYVEDQTNNRYGSTKIYDPNGKNAGIQVVSQGSDTLYIIGAVAIISGTSITLENNRRCYIKSGVVPYIDTVNKVKILKVIGYK